VTNTPHGTTRHSIVADAYMLSVGPASTATAPSSCTHSPIPQRNSPDLSTTDPDGVDSKHRPIEGVVMAVYKVVELVGTSPTSWEEAAKSAVAAASSSLRDLRIAEVSDLDMQIDGGEVVAYRAKVKVSFKHEAGG
jgi:flavin-binding protein dodecin